MSRHCSKCNYRFPNRVRIPADATNLTCFYCDNGRRAEAELRAREQERGDQIERDLAEGRRDGHSGRIMPQFED